MIYILHEKFPYSSRLCQEIVLVKSEVAELLFPEVIANLSRRTDVAVDLGQLICTKVLFLLFLTFKNYLIIILLVVLSKHPVGLLFIVIWYNVWMLMSFYVSEDFKNEGCLFFYCTVL